MLTLKKISKDTKIKLTKNNQRKLTRKVLGSINQNHAPNVVARARTTKTTVGNK